MSIYDYIPQLKEEVLKYDLYSGEKHISLKMPSFTPKSKTQVINSNPGSSRINKDLSKRDNLENGKLAVNFHEEFILSQSSPQTLSNNEKHTFAVMSEYWRRTQNMLDEKLGGPSDDKFLNETKLKATLMKADSTKNEILFLRMWDPEQLPNEKKAMRNSFAEWNDIIFQHDEVEALLPPKKADDIAFINSQAFSKSTFTEIRTKKHSTSRNQSDIQRERTRKSKAFKEALFNTNVRVVIGYRSVVVSLLTFVVFLLVCFIVYLLVIYFMAKSQEYEVTEQLLALWESAWKILTGVITVQKHLKMNPGPLSESMITENSLLVL
jgi:hypothetical protein